MSTSKATKAAPKAKVPKSAGGSPAGSTKRTPEETLYQALISGLQGTALGSGVIVLSTGATTPKELVTQLQAGLAATEAVKPAYASWRTTVAAQDKVQTQLQPVVVALKQFLRARFGAGSLTLAEFGLSSRPRKKPSPATEVAAATAARATRAAKKTVAAPVAATTAAQH